jgi:hypothetical protein
LRTVVIEFDGAEYTVPATFGTIERIEERINLFSFMRDASTNKPRIRDIAWVIFCALSQAGEKVSYADIGDKVLADFPTSYAAATLIAAEAVNGGPEKPSKKKTTPAASGRE